MQVIKANGSRVGEILGNVENLRTRVGLHLARWLEYRRWCPATVGDAQY